ncbi:MAG: hypothetical protein JXO72_13585 [Vicinamibacteria bacterium]|nr:hypothetical protein [Vicinamibacteria bacterium]
MLASGIEPVFEEWPILLLAFVSLTVTPLALLLVSAVGSGGLRSRLWVEELISRERGQSDETESAVWAQISDRLNALGFQVRSAGAPRRIVVFKGRESAQSGLLRHGFFGFVSARPFDHGVAIDVELRMVDFLLCVIHEDRQLDALAAYLCLRASDLAGVIGPPGLLPPGIVLAFITTSLGLIAHTAPSRIAPWISASSWAALGLLGGAALALVRRRRSRPGARCVVSGLYLATLPHLARLLRACIGA